MEIECIILFRKGEILTALKGILEFVLVTLMLFIKHRLHDHLVRVFTHEISKLYSLHNKLNARVDSIEKMLTDLREKISGCPKQELPTVTEQVPVLMSPATSIEQFQINVELLSGNSELSPVCSIKQLYYCIVSFHNE